MRLPFKLGPMLFLLACGDPADASSTPTASAASASASAKPTSSTPASPPPEPPKPKECKAKKWVTFCETGGGFAEEATKAACDKFVSDFKELGIKCATCKCADEVEGAN